MSRNLNERQQKATNFQTRNVLWPLETQPFLNLQNKLWTADCKIKEQICIFLLLSLQFLSLPTSIIGCSSEE